MSCQRRERFSQDQHMRQRVVSPCTRMVPVSVQAMAGVGEVSARAAVPARQLAARPRQARRSLPAPPAFSTYCARYSVTLLKKDRYLPCTHECVRTGCAGRGQPPARPHRAAAAPRVALAGIAVVAVRACRHTLQDMRKQLAGGCPDLGRAVAAGGVAGLWLPRWPGTSRLSRLCRGRPVRRCAAKLASSATTHDCNLASLQYLSSRVSCGAQLDAARQAAQASMDFPGACLAQIAPPCSVFL